MAPRRRGRRAAAVVCVLAALPLAALAGCTGSAPKPAAVAAKPVAAVKAAAALKAAAPAGLQFAPQASAASGPPAATIAKFRWSALAGSPLGYRNGPLLAWANGQLLEVGGFAKNSTGKSAAAAAFDPAAGRWRRIASAPAGASLADGPSSAVWTGRFLAVVSGDAQMCPPPQAAAGRCWTGAALYDPTANRWAVLALPAQFGGLSMAGVVWTGRDLIAAAVSPLSASNPNGARLALAAYAPTTRRWRLITPALPRGHSPGELYLVYDDSRLVLTSLWQHATQTTGGLEGTWGVDILTMNAQGTWRNVTSTWPSGIVYGTIATSDGILVTPGPFWCGDLCNPPDANSPYGYLDNPVTLTAKRFPTGPLGELDPGFLAWVWAGDAIITASTVPAPDGSPGHYILSGDMALYDPAARRWSDLPATPGHPAMVSSPVWTGTALLTLTTAGTLFAFHR